MDKIIKPRRAGKSLELIKIAEASNAYIIVPTRRDALNLMKLAEKHGHKILFPVTVDEYMQSRFRGSFVRNILIDDADIVLQMIFREVAIDAISMTDEGVTQDDLQGKA